MILNFSDSLLCSYLSAVLLVGLVLDATLGWAWAGLVIAAIAGKEGWDAWRGKGCCGPVAPAAAGQDAPACGSGGY